MPNLLYLTRHGQTTWNVEKRLQGQLDSPLTATGVEQSRLVAQALSEVGIDKIITSPLGRAVDTAKICQQALCSNTLIDKDLAERHLGDWQGQKLEQIQQDDNYHNAMALVTDWPIPSGESALDCGRRLKQCLINLVQKHANQNLLVVTHGEALRCLIYQLNQNTSDDSKKNALYSSAYELFDNGCIIKLHWNGSHFTFQNPV
ncbi:phosphoglycerate mutase [Saccharobesus litoralis]|uniref:Phosphoglycerate mutase n=1 Tax=Saccharobesus litoralis TaxID=2172099 RepID=A0A2S0VLX7_9ALTE|nr:histidine phosphatase family protein [Saccharobesus litoralis]AWB65195.1 phosphoglycerate mutase [Saccharobesus litoralis]